MFLALRNSRAFAPTQSFADTPETAPAFMPIQEVRQRLMDILSGCKLMDVQRLSFRVQATCSAKELWMLRSDLYDCVARNHSQSEAARRINSLLPCFDGWLPSRQLNRI